MVHRRKFAWLVALAALTAGGVLAPNTQADPPPKEPADAFQGEYAGTFTPAEGKAVPAVAYVAAERRRVQSETSYRVALKAVSRGLVEETVVGRGAKVTLSADLRGQAEGGKVAFSGKGWTGQIADGKLSAEGKAGKFALAFTVRKSPTELKPPPRGATVLLPYKEGQAPATGEWANAKWPAFDDGSMMVQGGDNRTKRQFTNFRLHAEFRIPMQSRGSGNSGFYLLDRYEVQVLDSFAKPPYKGGCAAIYQTFPPMVNASLPPGRWQTVDIELFGPVLEGGKCVKLPVITVVHNGILVHKDVAVPHATGNARSRGHGAPGPIRLQDHGNPVRYRNIWVEELSESKRPPARRTASETPAKTKATSPTPGTADSRRPVGISEDQWRLLQRARRTGNKALIKELEEKLKKGKR